MTIYKTGESMEQEQEKKDKPDIIKEDPRNISKDEYYDLLMEMQEQQ